MQNFYPRVDYNALISLDSEERDIKSDIMEQVEAQRKTCRVALVDALLLALLAALGVAFLGDEGFDLPVFILTLLVLVVVLPGLWSLYRFWSMRNAMNRSIGCAFGDYSTDVPTHNMLSRNIFRKVGLSVSKTFRLDIKGKSAEVVCFEGGSTGIEGAPSSTKGVYVDMLSGYNVKFPCSLNDDNICFIVSSYFKKSCSQFLSLGKAYVYEPLNSQDTGVSLMEHPALSWNLDGFLEAVSHIPDEAGVKVPYLIKVSGNAVELVLKLGSYRPNGFTANYVKWTSMMVDEMFVIKHIIERLDEALPQENH